MPSTPTAFVEESGTESDLDMVPEEEHTVRMNLDEDEGTPVPQRTRRRTRSVVQSESESEVELEQPSALSSSASSVGATPLPHPVPSAIPQFGKHVRQVSYTKEKDGLGLGTKSGLPKAAPRERLREKSTNVMVRERAVR